ncbi:MAG: aspartate aminotransferase family protein [Chloroflexi bacterium]|nr:aspartate aminotransferase family protein [Chloroflexota bacterium]
MTTIDRTRLTELLAQEERRFIAEHPRSRELFERAQACLLGGVPMSWMMKWAGGFPLFVSEARGAYVVDADGHRYVDLCLGDTGAMTGHAPASVVDAIAEQARRGITTMLPTEDSIWVGEELRRRFGLSFWQFTLTATDANRFALRLAREIAQRPYVLVYNGCYHGSVDESLIALRDGAPIARPGNVGPAVSPTVTTRVIEFNDLDALEAALAPGDVACVLAEPAMTNIGIIHPDPGYHAALREITRRTGTLLIVDETHTLCAGPGGYTQAHGLEPDLLTIGKPIGSGVPGGAYGMTEAVAERIFSRTEADYVDAGGIGGTLAGNALSLAAMRATLQHILTQPIYERTIRLALRFTEGVEAVIEDKQLPWHITRLGCRAEYRFRPSPPRNGSEAKAASDDELDRYMHLAALNRGILMTPFHSMALMSPDTTEADIDYHTRVFRESVEALEA